MKRKIAMALMAMLAAAALAGCGGEKEDTKENGSTAQAGDAAGTEEEDAGGQKATSGEITVYTALEDEQVSEYLAKFNETYPDITVNVVRESTGIITAKLIAEKDNPQADVIWGTAASSIWTPWSPTSPRAAIEFFRNLSLTRRSPPGWVSTPGRQPLW